MAAATTIKTCLVCKADYVPNQNVGVHGCTEHAAEYMATDNEGWFWPCCGARSSQPTSVLFYEHRNFPGSRGCVRSDHKYAGRPYCCRPPTNPRLAIDYEHGGTARVDSDSVYANAIDDANKVIDGKRCVVYMYNRDDFEKRSK